MNTALIGAIAGAVIGLLGGIIGTYLSVRNTNGSEERAFMIKASIACWIFVGLFLVLLFTLPNPYRQYLWIPYCILLPLGVAAVNRRQIRIKKQKAEQVGDGDAEEAV